MTWSEEVHSNRVVATLNAARETQRDSKALGPSDGLSRDKQRVQAEKLVRASPAAFALVVVTVSGFLFGRSILKRLGVDTLGDLPALRPFIELLTFGRKKGVAKPKEKPKPTAAKVSSTVTKAAAAEAPKKVLPPLAEPQQKQKPQPAPQEPSTSAVVLSASPTAAAATEPAVNEPSAADAKAPAEKRASVAQVCGDNYSSTAAPQQAGSGKKKNKSKKKK